jgi:putative membrane protein
MVPYAQDIQSWLFSFLWIEKSWILPLFMETVSIGFSLLFYFIFNTPFFDRLIVPKAVQKRNVYNRALRYFTESGIYSTQNHTGILIFTSWVERSIYILADDGIAKKIPQQTWNEIAFKISTGFLVGKASSITEAYLEAIKQCGDLLAEHFPAENNNPNELKDNLDIVGDGLVMFNEN